MKYLVKHARKPHTSLLKDPTASPLGKTLVILEIAEQARLIMDTAARYTGEENSHPDPEIDSILQEIRAEAMNIRRLRLCTIFQVQSKQAWMPYTNQFLNHYESLAISTGALCRAVCPSLLHELDNNL